MPESKGRKPADTKKLSAEEKRKAVEELKAKKPRTEEAETTEKPKLVAPGHHRWVAPAFIVVGLLGVIWLVVYYIAGRDVPFMNKLADWNILIGIGLMGASLALSMLWK